MFLLRNGAGVRHLPSSAPYREVGVLMKRIMLSVTVGMGCTP
jgi:hypothetical protein